jgi:hypothetical protein
LVDFGDALLSLHEEHGKGYLNKAIRAIERVRRTCRAILEHTSQHGSNAEMASSFLIAVKQWLIGAVELAEDIITNPPMVSSLLFPSNGLN